jgi:hypothetical protein
VAAVVRNADRLRAGYRIVSRSHVAFALFLIFVIACAKLSQQDEDSDTLTGSESPSRSSSSSDDRVQLGPKKLPMPSQPSPAAK